MPAPEDLEAYSSVMEDVRKRPPNPEVDSRKFGTALCYVKIRLQEGGVVALLSAGAG
ncbi:MAG: hypothetical protein H0U45_14775 [Tatlockia sp.]|nr:hypothetical protein [Tatlockia sp.]